MKFTEFCQTTFLKISSPKHICGKQIVQLQLMSYREEEMLGQMEAHWEDMNVRIRRVDKLVTI